MTREEARAWMERWKIVNQRTIEEARALTPEERFRKLEMLFASASLFPAPAIEEEDVRRVRDLWQRLRERYQS